MDTDLLSRVKQWSLWTMAKALPFDGGPSSTRVVYLLTAFAVIFCFVLTTVVFLAVYIRNDGHHADPIVAGLIATLATGITAFATNAHNVRHGIDAQNGCDPSQPGDAT
jgi:hypothetical protein